MKIGINTFHWSMNYGSTLQAYALCRTLSQMGHDVVVVDRHPRDQWNCLDNVAIHARSMFGLPFLLRVLLQFGYWSLFTRREAQKRFIRKNFVITSPPFYDWDEATGRELSVDMFVVGSDRVWDWEIIDPRPYLLVNAPKVPAIAYGCSFGHSKFDGGVEKMFQDNLSRFERIGVRESASVDMLAALGVEATHVVDPVMLFSPDDWKSSALRGKSLTRKRTVVCYFIDLELFERSIDDIVSFAQEK